MSTNAKVKPKRQRQTIDRPRAPGAPLSVEQAAEALNIAPRTVRLRIKEGKLRSYKDGRLVRIEEEDLIAYKAELRGQRPEEVVRAGTGLVRKHLVKPKGRRG